MASITYSVHVELTPNFDDGKSKSYYAEFDIPLPPSVGQILLIPVSKHHGAYGFIPMQITHIIVIPGSEMTHLNARLAGPLPCDLDRKTFSDGGMWKEGLTLFHSGDSIRSISLSADKLERTEALKT